MLKSRKVNIRLLLQVICLIIFGHDIEMKKIVCVDESRRGGFGNLVLIYRCTDTYLISLSLSLSLKISPFSHRPLGEASRGACWGGRREVSRTGEKEAVDETSPPHHVFPMRHTKLDGNYFVRSCSPLSLSRSHRTSFPFVIIVSFDRRTR